MIALTRFALTVAPKNIVPVWHIFLGTANAALRHSGNAKERDAARHTVTIAMMAKPTICGSAMSANIGGAPNVDSLGATKMIEKEKVVESV